MAFNVVKAMNSEIIPENITRNFWDAFSYKSSMSTLNMQCINHIEIIQFFGTTVQTCNCNINKTILNVGQDPF